MVVAFSGARIAGGAAESSLARECSLARLTLRHASQGQQEPGRIARRTKLASSQNSPPRARDHGAESLPHWGGAAVRCDARAPHVSCPQVTNAIERSGPALAPSLPAQSGTRPRAEGGRILDVDLSTGRTRDEALDGALGRRFLGGYGLGAKLLYDRMRPNADALGPDTFGPQLKFAGYDAVLVRGTAAAPVSLSIQDGRPELRDAGFLWGRDTKGGAPPAAPASAR